MKLYIKEKVFSFKDKFYIKDEYENDKYYVEGELFSIGKKLHVFDINENEVAYVHQKVLSFMPRFFVYVNGVEVAEIVKKISLFTPKYVINGLGWEVNGNFWAHDYSILDHDREIVSIHKAWMAWGDTYELDIKDNADELVALAVVLAIDCVMDAQNSSSSASFSN